LGARIHSTKQHSTEIYVARSGTAITGFAVISRSFFGRPFISQLFVTPDRRRQSIGSDLLTAASMSAHAPRVFTSTNESNATMIALLLQLGWTDAGVVDGLDEGDPERFYYWDRP
jgi:GNAT superfamily N-acetyltransferase